MKNDNTKFKITRTIWNYINCYISHANNIGIKGEQVQRRGPNPMNKTNKNLINKPICLQDKLGEEDLCKIYQPVKQVRVVIRVFKFPVYYSSWSYRGVTYLHNCFLMRDTAVIFFVCTILLANLHLITLQTCSCFCTLIFTFYGHGYTNGAWFAQLGLASCCIHLQFTGVDSCLH